MAEVSGREASCLSCLLLWSDPVPVWSLIDRSNPAIDYGNNRIRGPGNTAKCEAVSFPINLDNILTVTVSVANKFKIFSWGRATVIRVESNWNPRYCICCWLDLVWFTTNPKHCSSQSFFCSTQSADICDGMALLPPRNVHLSDLWCTSNRLFGEVKATLACPPFWNVRILWTRLVVWGWILREMCHFSWASEIWILWIDLLRLLLALWLVFLLNFVFPLPDLIVPCWRIMVGMAFLSDVVVLSVPDGSPLPLNIQGSRVIISQLSTKACSLPPLRSLREIDLEPGWVVLDVFCCVTGVELALVLVGFLEGLVVLAWSLLRTTYLLSLWALKWLPRPLVPLPREVCAPRIEDGFSLNDEGPFWKGFLKPLLNEVLLPLYVCLGPNSRRISLLCLCPLALRCRARSTTEPNNWTLFSRRVSSFWRRISPAALGSFRKRDRTFSLLLWLSRTLVGP